MGADGIPRWRFFTMSDGSPRWTSEGVQHGQVGSAAGIVGAWTTNTHHRGDPAGPFWMWKVAGAPEQAHDIDVIPDPDRKKEEEDSRGRLFDFTSRVAQ